MSNILPQFLLGAASYDHRRQEIQRPRTTFTSLIAHAKCAGAIVFLYGVRQDHVYLDGKGFSIQIKAIEHVDSKYYNLDDLHVLVTDSHIHLFPAFSIGLASL